jgi:hypothetical protein
MNGKPMDEETFVCRVEDNCDEINRILARTIDIMLIINRCNRRIEDCDTIGVSVSSVIHFAHFGVTIRRKCGVMAILFQMFLNLAKY